MLPERQPSTCRKGSTERRRLHECLCVVFRCLLWRPVLPLARLAVELHVYVLGLSKLWCRPSIREWGWSTESYYYMRPTPNHGHLHPEQNSHCREGIVPLLCALYFWNTVLFSRRAHQWFQGGRQWTQQTCCFQIFPVQHHWQSPYSHFRLNYHYSPFLINVRKRNTLFLLGSEKIRYQLSSPGQWVRWAQLVLLLFKDHPLPFRGRRQSLRGPPMYRYTPTVPHLWASWFT